MRTSKEWWAEVKQDDEKFILWLRKQYHGEMLAWTRVNEFATVLGVNRYKFPLLLIAMQEMKHAAMVGELLLNRGIEPVMLTDKPERYWDKALANVTSFEGIAAQAAWAEQMRLERIRVIAEDSDTPADIKEVFNIILKDEMFHAACFKQIAGDKAMSEAYERHEAGMAAIGLASESDNLIPESAVQE